MRSSSLPDKVLNRTLIEWFVVALLCGAVGAIATSQSWLWRVDGMIYDTALQLRQGNGPPDVVVVAIDDRSLQDIGRWPWSRAVHALLIDRLTQAGARVIALDLILHEETRDQPAADAALADAIARHGRVVLAVTHAAYGARSDGEALPAPVFARQAAALGHIHIELDPDGIARSLYLWEGMNRPQHPQLALAALRLYDPVLAAAFPPPASGVTPQIPGWYRSGWVHIPFIGPPGSFRYVSLVDVLRGDVPLDLFRDAVVFVGASAVGMGDLVPAPTSGHGNMMPGVEIHATLFSALREGRAIRVVDAGLTLAFASVMPLALMLILLRSTPRLALLATFACLLLIMLMVTLLLITRDLWLAPAGAFLACMLAYPLWSWRRLESAQHYLDQELLALQTSSHHLGAITPHAAMTQSPDRFGARIAVVRDAARRQHALQRFVSDTLDRLPVGAVVLGLDGSLRLCNQRARQLLQVDTDQAVSQQLSALPWPDQTLQGTTSAEPVRLEAQLGRYELLLTVAPLQDAQDSRLVGRVIGIADVTELRRTQRSREQTLSFLSHDLRAPMAAILTLAEHHGQTNPGKQTPPGKPDDTQDFVTRVERQARKALELADNLIRLAKAEAIDHTHFEPLSLEMLALDASDEVWALAQSAGLKIDIQPPADGAEPWVNGDADLLRRCLVNLLTNAIKHTPAGGRITLQTGVTGEHCLLQVSDTGHGIEPGLRDRLFQPFASGGDRGRLGGIGLGLLMVKTVVEKHGGTVTVASEPGQGTCFTLSLPLSP